MTKLTRQVIVTASAILCAVPAFANPAQKPDVAPFYAFTGKWRGTGELVEAGQEPAKLAMKLICAKSADSAAVSCEMSARNKQMNMAESDLFGVDPVTGTAHWYAVTNQGETHDHIVQWSDANNLNAHYAWQQDGKQMEENIAVAFRGRTMSFKSTVTADGKEMETFSAKLAHY